MARGECNCGAVQFEIDADLTDVFVCHCSICRRSTKRMFAPAGSIVAGGDALRVAHHIWVGSKAVWDEIGDAGMPHAEGLRGKHPGLASVIARAFGRADPSDRRGAPHMIGYVTLGTNDLPRAAAFYDALLAEP